MREICYDQLKFVIFSSYVQSRDVGAGNCNGGRGVYQTFCHGIRSKNTTRETNVEKCFFRLWNGIHLKWGCRTLVEGSCQCTVDSSFIFNWSRTFNEARQRLHQQCQGFSNTIMERYEGDMYLTAICD